MTEPDPEHGDGDRRDRRPTPSVNRIVIWIVGIGVGGYLVISGLVGILTHR